MRCFYSKSTRGFYNDGKHKQRPSDCKEITNELRIQLLEDQSQGKEIVPDENGHPVAITPVVNDEQLADRARSKRDQLLRGSDFTQLEDSPKDKAAWKIYRQELRLIPNQPGFPTDIVWPSEPE